MAEDWRITIDFDDEADGTQLVEWLAARRFESEERDSFAGRVAVSRDGPRVFLYADTEELARDADGIVRALLSSEGRQARVAFERWHPVEQDWKDAAIPLPGSDEEIQAERGRQQEREAAESLATGEAEWEVRVSLPSREATDELADRLESEGIPVTRRATFLLVGAVNQDEATALAERLRGEAPDGVDRRGGARRRDGLGGQPEEPVRRLRRAGRLTTSLRSGTLDPSGPATKGG